MKKLSISLIALMFATPSFATGIGASAESANCDNGVLGTYTGPASLSANWTANTIHLDFYDGEDKLSSGQCTYDGGIELPNDPTKEGYEFSGWKVRRAAAAPAGFDMAVLVDYINMSGLYTGKGLNINKNKEYCRGATSRVDFPDITTCDSVLDLQVGEWKSTFVYGNVKGVAKCSAKAGDNNAQSWDNASSNWSATESELDNASGEGIYCWCKVTGFDSDKDGEYVSVVPTNFIFSISYANINNCAAKCPGNCGLFTAQEIYYNLKADAFRSALYGIIK
jgi:hypothetical protein